MPHIPVACQKVEGTAHAYRLTVSYLYRCSTCGLSRRWSRDFLGAHHAIVCDGRALTRQSRSDLAFIQYTALVNKTVEHALSCGCADCRELDRLHKRHNFDYYARPGTHRPPWLTSRST